MDEDIIEENPGIGGTAYQGEDGETFKRISKQERDDHRRGIMTVIGGVFLMIYLGCFFLWGNISIYVLSYFHETNPDVNYGFIFLVDTFLVLANCIGYQIGTFLLQKLRWHPKVILSLGVESLSLAST